LLAIRGIWVGCQSEHSHGCCGWEHGWIGVSKRAKVALEPRRLAHGARKRGGYTPSNRSKSACLRALNSTRKVVGSRRWRCGQPVGRSRMTSWTQKNRLFHTSGSGRFPKRCRKRQKGIFSPVAEPCPPGVFFRKSRLFRISVPGGVSPQTSPSEKCITALKKWSIEGARSRPLPPQNPGGMKDCPQRPTFPTLWRKKSKSGCF